MRPNSEFQVYSVNGQKNNNCYDTENKNRNPNKFFVSSNVYYGYYPHINASQQRTENVEHMDLEVEHNESVPINNGILLHKRLCANQNVNRKRPFEYEKDDAPAPMSAFKKRRETELLQQPFNDRCVNLRQPTHNIPDIPRTLMGHYI